MSGINSPKCNKCDSTNLEKKVVMDFMYHKCKDCGNEQKIYWEK